MSQKGTEVDVGTKVWPTPGPVARNRIHCTLTVHPETLPKLDALCRKQATSRGRLFDRMVQALFMAYRDKKMYCVTGEVCKIGREDLPEIL